MKNISSLLAIALMAAVMVGCGDTKKDTEPANTTGQNASSTPENTKVAFAKPDADLCAKCGCCAGCDDCCKGAKCDGCGMQKGSELCCSGVKPAEGTYCKGCGEVKGTDKCCAEGAEKCSGCGLAKGSPICCKVKADGDKGHKEHDGHDDDGDDHGHDHDKDKGHDDDKHEG